MEVKLKDRSFYTNTINKKFAPINGQDKLKGVLFTKLIEETNEMIDNTNRNKENMISKI